MARVDLEAVIISDVADPSDYLRLVYVRSFQKAAVKPGRVVAGAGGRRRLFTRAGQDVSWSLTFGTTTPAEKAWLEGHKGRLVCVRDDRGGKVFGVYLSVAWDERTWSRDAENVRLDITELTFSEAA